jgi:inorganic pyrophosphatase
MDYWQNLDKLVSTNGFKIERPKDSAHPRYPDYIYPLDYGFILNTKSADGDELDAWHGSLESDEVTGIAVTLDPIKGDSEVKVLIGCNDEDKKRILAAHSRGDMTATILNRA